MGWGGGVWNEMEIPEGRGGGGWSEAKMPSVGGYGHFLCIKMNKGFFLSSSQEQSSFG